MADNTTNHHVRPSKTLPWSFPSSVIIIKAPNFLLVFYLSIDVFFCSNNKCVQFNHILIRLFYDKRRLKIVAGRPKMKLTNKKWNLAGPSVSKFSYYFISFLGFSFTCLLICLLSSAYDIMMHLKSCKLSFGEVFSTCVVFYSEHIYSVIIEFGQIKEKEKSCFSAIKQKINK